MFLQAIFLLGLCFPLKFSISCPTKNNISIGYVIPNGTVERLEGSTVVLDCGLDDNYTGPGGPGDLFWKVSGQKLSEGKVELLNDTVLRLTIKNATMNDSGMYICSLQVEPTRNKGVCMTRIAIGIPPQKVNNFSCISHNWENILCTWEPCYNPVKTNFTLSYLQKPGMMSTNCTSKAHGKNGRQCLFSAATFPIYRQTLKIYNFRLTMTNVLGSYVQDFIVDQYSRMIPSPPIGLKVQSEDETGDGDLVLKISWANPAPLDEFPPGIIYRVLYRSQWDDESANYSIISMGTEKHLRLQGVYANSVYDIQVQARSAAAPTVFNYQVFYEHNSLETTISPDTLYNHDQWWGKSSVLRYDRTPAKRPSKSPDVSGNSYQVINELETRQIHVFWTKLREFDKNGENFNYFIYACPLSFNASDAEELESQSRDVKARTELADWPELRSVCPVVFPVDKRETNARFVHLRSDISYLFTLFASNDAGRSRNLSTIVVGPQKQLPKRPEKFTVVAYDHGVYKVSWEPPTYSVNEDLSALLGDGKSKEQIDSYTVFWCDSLQPRPFHCPGTLRWQVVSSNVTTVNLTLPEAHPVHRAVNYQFAVASTAANGFSSGMIWQTCTVPYNGTLNKMRHIRVNSISSQSFEVTWQLDCSERYGMVEGFKVYYCVVANIRSVCIGEIRTIEVRGSSSEHVVIKRLSPYTTYKITVAAVTAAGEGEHSDPLYNRTAQSVPGESARDVQVLWSTNSSFGLRWLSPLTPNGIITKYSIKYAPSRGKERIDPVSTQVTLNMLADNASTAVNYKMRPVLASDDPSRTVYEMTAIMTERIKSYRNYSVSVQSCTVVGCAPHSSASVHFETKIGVPTGLDKPRARLLNHSIAMIERELPALPNGPINAWQLRIRRQEAGSELIEDFPPSPYYNASVDIIKIPVYCKDSDESVTYMFSTRFINYLSADSIMNFDEFGFPKSDGDDLLPETDSLGYVHLTSDWSDETILDCMAALEWNLTNTIALVLLLGLSLLLCACLVSLYFFKNVKTKWREMRAIKVELPKGFQSDDIMPYDDEIMKSKDGFLSGKFINISSSVNEFAHLHGLNATGDCNDGNAFVGRSRNISGTDSPLLSEDLQGRSCNGSSGHSSVSSSHTESQISSDSTGSQPSILNKSDVFDDEHLAVIPETKSEQEDKNLVELSDPLLYSTFAHYLDDPAAARSSIGYTQVAAVTTAGQSNQANPVYVQYGVAMAQMAPTGESYAQVVEAPPKPYTHLADLLSLENDGEIVLAQPDVGGYSKFAAVDEESEPNVNQPVELGTVDGYSKFAVGADTDEVQTRPNELTVSSNPGRPSTGYVDWSKAMTRNV